MIRNVRLIFSRALRQCFFLTKGFGSAELANHTLQQYPPKKRWMKRNRSWRSCLWVPRETGDSVFALKDGFAAGNEPAARLKCSSMTFSSVFHLSRGGPIRRATPSPCFYSSATSKCAEAQIRGFNAPATWHTGWPEIGASDSAPEERDTNEEWNVVSRGPRARFEKPVSAVWLSSPSGKVQNRQEQRITRWKEFLLPHKNFPELPLSR